MNNKRKSDMKYLFYGSETKQVSPIDDKYRIITDQRMLYDLLSTIWCKDTCAPRMRDRWTKENKTLGQCSITAFIVQDIFGGKVYGIPLKDGSFHCFNVVEEVKFDLTSEQFENVVLDYDEGVEQFREEHFLKEEKYLRYLYLKKELERQLKIL